MGLKARISRKNAAFGSRFGEEADDTAPGVRGEAHLEFGPGAGVLKARISTIIPASGSDLGEEAEIRGPEVAEPSGRPKAVVSVTSPRHWYAMYCAVRLCSWDRLEPERESARAAVASKRVCARTRSWHCHSWRHRLLPGRVS